MRKSHGIAGPAGLLLIASSILIAAGVGCSDAEVVVTRRQFGAEWPLEVNSASVICAEDGDVAILRLGAKRYALNEAARSRGHPGPEEVLREGADPAALGAICSAQVAANR